MRSIRFIFRRVFQFDRIFLINFLKLEIFKNEKYHFFISERTLLHLIKKKERRNNIKIKYNDTYANKILIIFNSISKFELHFTRKRQRNVYFSFKRSIEFQFKTTLYYAEICWKIVLPDFRRNSSLVRLPVRVSVYRWEENYRSGTLQHESTSSKNASVKPHKFSQPAPLRLANDRATSILVFYAR